jgi:hypothetical protein
VIGLLSGALSGAVGLIAPEPCGALEPPGAAHANCPPSCLQCNCCRQPGLPGLPAMVASPAAHVEDAPAADRRPDSPDPADILHVPRRVA